MSKVAGVSVVEQHKAQVAGSVASGQALAETLVSTVKAQAGSLKQFLTGQGFTSNLSQLRPLSKFGHTFLNFLRSESVV